MQLPDFGRYSRYNIQPNVYGAEWTNQPAGVRQAPVGMSVLREFQLSTEQLQGAMIAAESRAVGTRKIHQSIIKHYVAFCESRGYDINTVSEQSLWAFVLNLDTERKGYSYIMQVLFLLFKAHFSDEYLQIHNRFKQLAERKNFYHKCKR